MAARNVVAGVSPAVKPGVSPGGGAFGMGEAVGEKWPWPGGRMPPQQPHYGDAFSVSDAFCIAVRN